MDLRTLTTTGAQLLSMFCHRCGMFRGSFRPAKSFHFILVLSCTLFCLATCGPRSTNGMQKSPEYGACGSYEDNQRVGFRDIIAGDASSGYIAGSSMTHPNIESVCTSLNLLCFPSTLPGFFSKEHKLKRDALEVSRIHYDSPLSIGTNQANRGTNNVTQSSQNGMFKFLNGRTVSCLLNSEESSPELSSIGTDSSNQNVSPSCRRTSLNQNSKNVRPRKNYEGSKPGSFDVFSSPKVGISPPILDWGPKYLFFPSVAFLTVVNSLSDSVLHVYEPFSTNTQFYPCNSSEILLGPGEVASICFVFLPRWLGLTTAHLILQTSSGGFLVPAKGFGVESPYKIQPLVDLDVLSSGRLIKNLSLFNPYDETLHLVEVTSWISVSVGNTTHHTEASCTVENLENFDELSLPSVNKWLVVRGGQVGSPLMAMRPHRNWEIGPHNSETIIEMDFPFRFEGKVFGAFCMHLMRSPLNVSDTVMVPLEVDLDAKAAYNDHTPVSVYIDSLVSCDAGWDIVAVSLRNRASYMLNVVRISEVTETKIFKIKYEEGLLLFPGTLTQVAVITYTQLPVELYDSLPEASDIDKSCKVLILTNLSSSPQIEIPCQEIIHVHSRHQKDSSMNESGNVEPGNMRKGSSSGDEKVPSVIKALETAVADEVVLGNWKSQGATSGMSVLDDHEVVFPMVQIGCHHSKWINVKNPSQQPVVMQLILNSGEIIDECRHTDGFVEPPSSVSLVHGKSTRPTRCGFSIAESALTEAYVHPHGTASFGPILFHPSNRCAWRSSALIRNNLSGVEWLSLRGLGGSLSLVLFEGSKAIESVEFNLNLPVPNNISPPDVLLHKEETTSACLQRLSKELFAKNRGDFPLEVISIEVSGAGCELDGFVVHNCTGFSLKPGETTKLLISYQTDFSAVMVHRDLELALASDIFVIPMKASLPVVMLNLCKKSVFWMPLKKFAIVAVLVSLIFLVFCCLFLQMITSGFQYYLYKNEKSYIPATRTMGKSHLHQNQRNTGISVPGEMNCVLRSVDEAKPSKQASHVRYPDSQKGALKEMTTQHAKLTLENHGQTDSSSDMQKEKVVQCLPSQSVVVETSDSVESHIDLTVRIGKKGRRRRKRKGAGATLAGVLDVSSSQSGNSTPSSPLSPVTTLTVNRACLLSPDVDQPNGYRYLFTQMGDECSEKGTVPEPASEPKILEPQLPVRSHSYNHYSPSLEQPSGPRKTASKPVLLPAATFPCACRTAPSLLCSSSLASKSTIAPHARAPGTKVYQKTVTGEQAGCRDEHTYDIWGDHFSGLSFIGRSKDTDSINHSATRNDSDSFFVSGPQTLLKNSQLRSVSCFNQGG